MLTRQAALTAIVLAGTITALLGQARQGGGPPPAQLTIQPVKPGLYAILNPGANTLAVRVTSDGVILVDDMFEQNYDQIIALIKSVTDQPLKYVISTHHHGDHTGGNVKMITQSRALRGEIQVPYGATVIQANIEQEPRRTRKGG